jgi:hypothetical protein
MDEPIADSKPYATFVFNHEGEQYVLRSDYERLRAMLRWIAVEEQWPKHGSDVLVAYKAGQYDLLGVGEFDGTTVNDDGVTVPYFKGIGGFEVTHWMPLPEPPEMK